SENYQHCLSCLFDGLERQYEFLVMTGDVGAGKTFLLNTLVKSLDEKTHVAFLDHSKFNSSNLLQYVSQEFGLEPAGKSKFELLLNLKNSLLDEKAILIIDEAENLSVDILEELRLLTDFENYEKTLVQIILAGQLQLEEM